MAVFFLKIAEYDYLIVEEDIELHMEYSLKKEWFSAMPFV